MFIDALKFNLTESVECLFLTSIDTTSKALTWRSSNTYSPTSLPVGCFNWNIFCYLSAICRSAKHSTWHSINRSSITYSYFSAMAFITC